MKAWQVHRYGEPQDAMRFVELEEPQPGTGELRLRVDAVALNFVDLLLCRGEYQERPELPFTPGLEVCGTVLDGPRAGERVLAPTELPHGGLAEQVIVAEGAALALPADLPAAGAASMFVTYQTGYVGLHRRAALQPGETLLVHAGASGVGSAAIQLGLAAGARVLATAGGPDKVELCRGLGAEVAIDYKVDDFVGIVKDLTDGRGADVIYDPVGGATFDRSRKCIAFEGRLLIVGFASGTIADAPTNHALVKNYSVIGLHFGLYRKRMPSIVVETHDALMELWKRGDVDPLIGAQLPLDEAADAIARLGQRATVGKTVLVP